MKKRCQKEGKTFAIENMKPIKKKNCAEAFPRFISAMACLLATALVLTGTIRSEAGSLLVGSSAPAFELPDINGKTLRIEDFKGKVVLLNFWAPWCVPCRAEMPQLDMLYRKYGNTGFEVIGVCESGSPTAVSKFLQESHLTFPILLDHKEKVADDYRVSGLPASFIIGRDGVVRYVHAGFGPEFLPLYENEIEGLLKQQKINH